MPSWTKRTATLRDLGLALVPGLYVLGFLSWSMFFWRTHLGFHALPAPQYLLAGTLLVLLVGPLCLLEAWLHVRAAEGPAESSFSASLKFAGWVFLLRLSATAVWFELVGSILSPFKIVHLSLLQFLVMGGLIGGFAAAVLFMLPWRSLRRHARPSVAPNSDGGLSRAAGRAQRAVSWGFPVFLWLLLGIYTMGYLVIDNAETEFGGGMSREAYLGLDARDVPPELAAAIGASNATTGVLWTVKVNVVFHDSQSIIFVIPGTSAHGTRFELDRVLVKVIAWA